MSIYHFKFKSHSLGKNPKLIPLRAYAYRVGAMAQRPVTDPKSGKSYNYRYKREACWVETTAPAGAPDWMRDGVALWSHVTAMERDARKDAVMFYEFEAALPIECDIDTWIRIVRAYVAQELTARNVVATATIHNKPGNPHFHLMATTRHIEFEAGEFGSKNKALKQLKALHSYRAGLAEHINVELRKLGLPLVTHKSFAAQAIDKEATKHVGVMVIDPSAKQKAQRIQRERHNADVKSRNAVRVEKRRSHAHAVLPAGACGARWVQSLHSGPHTSEDVAEILQHKVTPVMPMAMSFEEQLAYNYMHRSLPHASSVFEELGHIRTALGRQWSWETFQVQYQRLDEVQRTHANVRHTLQVKELIWVVSRSPRLLDAFAQAMPAQSLVAALQSASPWVTANKPAQVAKLETLLNQAQSGHAGIKAVNILRHDPTSHTDAGPVQPVNSADPTYADILAPFSRLVFDMDRLIGQCQAVATALERPLSPAILAKRLARMAKDGRVLQTQSELRDVLLGAEVIFAAKRRPHKLAAVLDAVPLGRRGHFEKLVASVLGGGAMDARHAMAAGSLSGAALAEVQAEFHLRHALSEFQINDFELRKHALESIGQTYAWSEFQRDIQRLHKAEAGWQQAWWDEKLAGLGGKRLSLFQANVPGWFAVAKVVPSRSFPLGSYDSNPLKSWLSAWQTQPLQQPQPGIPLNITVHAAMPGGQGVDSNLDRIWQHGGQNRPLPACESDFGSCL